MITLALTGDVMLGRQVNKALRIMSSEQPWGDVLPLLLSADGRRKGSIGACTSLNL